MLLLAFLCLSPFLQSCFAEYEAILPAWPSELTNAKNRNTLRLERAGRPVTIPVENIKKMENVPLSSLSTSNPNIRSMIIDTHNSLRKIVNPPARNMLKMVWNDEAARTADNYAKMCLPNHSEQNLRKITNFNCGENLFMSTFKASWDDVIKSFYSEVVDFEYGKGAKTPGVEIGHYTQLTWATSRQVGCAINYCANNNLPYRFVCHYCPPGNNLSSMGYPYKSGPTCGDCPAACDNGLCTNYCSYQDWFSDCFKYYHGQQCDASLEKDCPATCKCTNKEIK
ncbi:cysteine-rich secretory protein 2 [Spea bombifrons]|uniref:cysteine-rich secretory protein 2 n=1 Tax=Spea bombifrons TaxID=233779 RepID=UPI00234BA2D0|nr:cysteine-rich secretory protein 2 [Spea bombifrons]